MSTSDTNILKRVSENLAKGALYTPEMMRQDVIALFEMAKKHDEIMKEALNSPLNAKPMEEAAVRVLHRNYQREQESHKKSREELELAKQELTNLKKWLRSRHALSEESVKELGKRSPEPENRRTN